MSYRQKCSRISFRQLSVTNGFAQHQMSINTDISNKNSTRSARANAGRYLKG